MIKPIRTAAKAVIIQDEKLLCVKKQQGERIYFLLPGGGQHHGETLVEALQRECWEEIGAPVIVREALHVREYIGKNHHEQHRSLHQVEVLFACALKYPNQPFSLMKEGDKYQIGVEWVALSALQDASFYPKALIPALIGILKPAPLYVGDLD
jgi:8-oxo-dGTP pyrophosphatase MutT (NUDIX family)